MAIAKRKKRFFDVDIPIIRKTTHLQAYELKELEGRTFKYDLTRVLRGKALLLNMKTLIKDEKATSIPIGSKLMPFYMKRVIRIPMEDEVSFSISMDYKVDVNQDEVIYFLISNNIF